MSKKDDKFFDELEQELNNSMENKSEWDQEGYDFLQLAREKRELAGDPFNNKELALFAEKFKAPIEGHYWRRKEIVYYIDRLLSTINLRTSNPPHNNQ